MYRKEKEKPGQLHGKMAQATLEFALTIISLFILLWGFFQVFYWLNAKLVLRQEVFEDTRTSEAEINEEDFPKLNIFGNLEYHMR